MPPPTSFSSSFSTSASFPNEHSPVTTRISSSSFLSSTSPHLAQLYSLLQLPAELSIPSVQSFLRRPDIFTYEELVAYIQGDENRAYTRNLVFANDLFALMVLVWSPKRDSPIHDHSGSSCYVKAIKGAILETVYQTKPSDKTITEAELSDATKQTRMLKAGQVGYIHDNIGIHKMENASDDWAVSVHMYTPPFEVCKTFGKSGQINLSRMEFDTIGGVKANSSHA